MLHAIDQNKAGRNFSASEVHWRSLFSKSEDSLTSSIIGSLLYLPDDFFWQIINNSVSDNYLPKGSFHINHYDFWPSWDAKNTRNIERIEPDVFIRTEAFDLIIEAKTDINTHEYNQWLDQSQAYCNEYNHPKMPLYYIALGGNLPQTRSIEVEGRKVHVMACKWHSILEQVTRIYDSLGQLQYSTYSTNSIKRVLQDIILAYNIHGYFSIKWINDIKDLPFLGINNLSQTLFSSAFLPSINFIDIPYSNITEDSINLLNTISYELPNQP